MTEDSQTPKFPERVLVVLAHPDDESYGMGGTLAKLSHHGAQIDLLCATRGELGIPGKDPEEAGQIRENELLRAADFLGVDVHFLGYYDGALSRIDRTILVEHIASWIGTIQPDLILTFGPDGISGHLDHIAISNAVTQVVDHFYPDVDLLYIAPSEATVLGCGVSSSQKDFDESLFAIDIGDFKIKKIHAIQSHKSQNSDLIGKPEDLFDKIPCSEYFSIAHTKKRLSEVSTRFQVVPESERD